MNIEGHSICLLSANKSHHFHTNVVGKFASAQCQRSYVSKSGRTEHVDKMHKKLYRYRCGTCDRGYMVRYLYDDHIAAHTGVK